MATEGTQEAVLQFLTERGGRVKNVELMDYFKPIFPNDPDKKAIVRETFKRAVDNVAFVKIENGVKMVCLKKKYRGSMKWMETEDTNGTTGKATALTLGQTTRSINGIETVLLTSASDMTPSGSDGEVHCCEYAVNDEVQQEISPGSGYGTDKARGVKPQPDISEIFSQGKTGGRRASTESVSQLEVVQNISFSDDMGNVFSSKEQKKEARNVIQRNQTSRAELPDVPEISVIEASPLPAAADGSMFTLPGHLFMQTIRPPLGQDAFLDPTLSNNGTGTTESEGEHVSSGLSQGSKEVNFCNAPLVTRRRTSRGSQRSLESSHPSEDGPEEGQYDFLSESESSTPKDSRKNFIKLMMNSSPQVRRSMVLRNSVYLSARCRDPARSDSDSASLVSSTTDEYGALVTLDPLEHEWMMCASDGQWESLHRLLASEPYLIMKKDFVTGFTCLHWAAKQGKQDLLALIINFAKQHAVHININARSSAGYTPLHLAAMHNCVDVMKLLIGAYDADVEARDYSGRKASQYLTNSVTEEIRDIIGAGGDSDSENTDYGNGGRWRLSKVLQSKLLNHNEDDSGDGSGLVKQKPLRRKSSFSKMKPRLQKIRTQIVHSTSFRETEELDGSVRSSLKSRPKSNLFG